MSTPPAIAEEGEKRSAVFCQVTGVHLMCQIFMNDLLPLGNRNQIQITIRSVT